MPEANMVRQKVAQALRMWENNSKLTFREMYSDQADIQVLFARRNHGDGYKFDGPGQVLAHAFYPAVGRGGDAHFDEEEIWDFNGTSENAKGTSFFNVALHELGHSLGLGHSSDPNAVMRPWYESNEVDKLPDDDRNAIQELYGSKDKIWAPYRPHIPPPTTTTTTTMRPRVYYPQTRPNNNYPSYTPNYYPNRDRTREDEERERERQRQIEQERERQRQIEKTERDRIHRLKLEERERQERERERIKRLREERERQEYLRREYERQQRERAEREREREEREREREEHERGRERERTRATPPTYPARRIPATQPSYRTYNNPSQRANKPYKPRKTKPDSCTTSYDAISMLRGELFIFKGQFVWRFGASGLYNGYPTDTRMHWPALQEDFHRVDAVYENKRDHIYFFIGRQYYVFERVSRLLPGYPKPLTSLGLPATLTHVDAAFVWGHNNRTYLTSGKQYWSIDDATDKVELDYPRNMSFWAGVGYNIDAAFQYTNGKTYFFKNDRYWEFDDNRMKVAHPQSKLSSHKWMQCKRSVNDVDEEQRRTASLVSGSDGTANSGSRNSLSLTGFMALVLTWLAWRS